MKTKLKKHLFTKSEKIKLNTLLNSRDKECVKLGMELVKASKTYKHYYSHFSKNRFVSYYQTYIDFVDKYSH